MKRSILIALAVALLASCATKEIDVQAPVQDDVEFYASFEQPAEEGTRVYANEDLLLRWTADDRVSIFNKNTYNQQYRFTGNTGANAGGFAKMESDEFISSSPIEDVVSVYPYLASTEISESETITINLPAEQAYAENSFGLGANTMVSVTSDNFIKYKNVGGYLMLKLYGQGVSVSSITLKGNNGEKLAGKATVTMPLDGVPSVMMASDATAEITLACATPVQLGATAEESTQFWFVVPPVTFSKGFTVMVNVSTGGVFRKSTSKGITIVRNNLSKMAPMEVVVPVPELIDLGLPSGLKWASFNLGATSPEGYGDYYAWGEIEPYYGSGSAQSPSPIWKEGKSGGYAWPSYKWCMGDNKTMTKYCNSSSYGYQGFTDTKTVLDSEDDAANVNLCSGWRMPKDKEWTELRNNCTWTWTTQNGVYGCLVAASNGNSIFLPATGYWNKTNLYPVGSYGYYWSSSLCTGNPNDAWYVLFGSDDVNRAYGERYLGFSVRPVYDDRIHPESISLNNTTLSLNVGVSEQLTATILPETTTDKTVSWSSSDESIATVSSTGQVTGVSVGSVIITATTNDGRKTATCSVTVVSISIPAAVDLGLSVKWASFNLGASVPEEYGDHYAWGETEPYYSSLDPLTWKEGKENGYDWASYNWCMGEYNSLTKYCSQSGYGYNGFTDNKTVLDREDDAAHVNLGGSWRMPTYAEWDELINNCTWTWTTQKGVNGYLVTGPNDNSIFLPAAGNKYEDVFNGVGLVGEYWSSCLYSFLYYPNYPDLAMQVAFHSRSVGQGSYERYYGASVRPVYAM